MNRSDWMADSDSRVGFLFGREWRGGFRVINFAEKGGTLAIIGLRPIRR